MTIFTLIIYLIIGIYSAGLILFLIGLFFPQKGSSTRQPFVSVVVAARNEADNIGACLDGLIQQTYPEELYEIIIVSDNSVDATDQIVTEYARKKRNVHLLRLNGVPDGLTPKKNAITRGIQHSRGEIILTTDADCLVKNTWVETMISYFTDGVGMVVGFSQLGQKGQPQTLLEKLQAFDFVSLMASAAGSSSLGIPLAASGQNLAYRRDAFDAVGGFAQVGHRVSGDDVLLLQLIKQRTDWNIKFAYSAQAHNVTRPEKRVVDLLNQRIRWASNGPYQLFLNLPFFSYILTTFLANVSIILNLILAAGGVVPWALLYNPWVIKITCEFLLTLKGALVFKRTDLVKYFPLWTMLQIPYVLLVGLLGSLGNFNWKGREHRIRKQYLKWGEKR